MITGVNHITLSVRSLEESFWFYKEILGFKPLMKSSKSAYFLAGDLWFCIEESTETRLEPLPEYTHIAFSVGQKGFEEIAGKIRASGAHVFKENKSEGNSIYFLDPSDHKLEIHVGDWKSRLDQYRGLDGVEIFPVN